MAAFTYLHYNPNTFDIALLNKTVTLHPVIYGILIVILIWVSINVTNCSDGVDGLCGTLSAVTLTTAYILFRVFDIEPVFRHMILLMVVCILGYLWFNASPSRLLMGDAGSRAIGIFIAFVFLKLHHPLLYIPVAIMLILDGGLGLIKVSFMRFLHINIMKNIRTPIHDHMRKKKEWSDAQVVFRFAIIQIVVGLAVIYALI
jgi:phospho-N-acetylmuramoyl-pentapeptide-transferase